MGIFDPNIKKLEKKGNVVELINALHNKKEKIRCKAAEALARLGKSSAQRPIINSWLSGNIPLTDAVAWAINGTKNPKAIKELLRRTEYCKKMLKKQAQITRELGGNSEKDLLSELFLLKYKNCIHSLGIIGNSQAVDVLIDTLKDYGYTLKKMIASSSDPQQFVMEAATSKHIDPSIFISVEQALVDIGESAIEAIKKLSKSKNELLRQSSKRILDRISGK